MMGDTKEQEKKSGGIRHEHASITALDINPWSQIMTTINALNPFIVKQCLIFFGDKKF